MSALKNMFGKPWVELLAGSLRNHHRSFDKQRFTLDCLAPLPQLKLNQRMRHISTVMRARLPQDYLHSLAIMREAVKEMPGGYTNLVFPDFVGQFGIGSFDASMDALAYFTGFGSSEFAVREFLKADFKRTLRVMYRWAESPDHHVRRLASEGSRPMLPWSFRLAEVVRDPSLTRPILHNLRADPELYVRRSVANHLNDISKFDPAYMLQLLSSWDQKDSRTAWIVRHASRTLIKKGHAGALKIFRFDKKPRVTITNLGFSSPKIRIGDDLEFFFTVVSEKPALQRLAIDYRVHYVKQRGVSIKIFKLREVELKPGGAVTLRKKQRFTDFSTRKHFPGTHKIEIQVNGVVLASKSFRLHR